MGKNPAFQFYPSDWTRDLDDQDLEVEGAWIRICCRLWWSDTPGKITKSLQEWSRILRKNKKKTEFILQTLVKNNIADGDVLDKGKITILNRRMIRDREISELRKESGSLGGNPKLTTLYNKPGYVYAVQKEDGLVKIGIAINPENRINKLRYKERITLTILHVEYVENMGLVEKELHEKYINEKVIGEWFRLSTEQIEELIITLKGKGNQIPHLTPPPSSSSSSSSTSIKNKTKRASFVIPTLEEITAYCQERCNQINPNGFLDHYTGNGWMVGKNKMKDWKAVIRTWETRNGGNGNGIKQGGFSEGSRKDANATGGNWLPKEYTPEQLPERAPIPKEIISLSRSSKDSAH